MAKPRGVLGLAIALSLTAAARADDVPCPVATITVTTVPALPDPWFWMEGQTWEKPRREFRLLQGKEMVVCRFSNPKGYDWIDLLVPEPIEPVHYMHGRYFMVAQRPVTIGVPDESYPCPFNHFQTQITTALPTPWEKVTYSFTLHEKRLSHYHDRVTCTYRGPDSSVAHTSPSTIVRPLKLDDPKLTSNPSIPSPALGLTQGFAVTFVKLTTISPSPQQTVPCPAKVQMHGQIDANGPGLVRFRLVHDGVAGPVTSVNFTKAGSKAEIFDLTVEPKPPDGPGTLAQAPPPPPGFVQGLAHVEIVEPTTGKKVSNDAAYSLKCLLAVPGKLVLPTKPPGAR